MKANPKVFIIILNYNNYEETINCVNYVKNINYTNYKIVIVDNNSKDDSFNILKKIFPEEKLIKSGLNLGYASGNNLGIKYALDNGAEYICILNNDVEVEKDFLKIIIDNMESDKTIGIGGPCICEYSDRDKIQAMGANINLFLGLAQGKYKGLDYHSLNEDKLEVDYLGGACFVVRAEVFSKIGLIPEMYFLFFEETEFCLKAKRDGFKLVCFKESKVYHKGSHTISKYSGLSYYFLNRNRIIFIRRNAKLFHKLVFAVYVIIEGIGRLIIRNEPIQLFKYFYEGMKDDRNKADLDKISEYVEL